MKERDPSQFTKSGLMVGLGETKEEVMQVMDDMRSAGVDFLTIGQYLQPSRKHAAVEKFWTPEEFQTLETIARSKGFLLVSSSPLTRSSYHADEDFARLRAARAGSAGLLSVTTHSQTMNLPYRPEDMFDLVSDVGSLSRIHPVDPLDQVHPGARGRPEFPLPCGGDRRLPGLRRKPSSRMWMRAGPNSPSTWAWCAGRSAS